MPIFRWQMAAGFATVVAVGAMAWNALGPASRSATELALVAAPPAATRSVVPAESPLAKPPGPVLARNEGTREPLPSMIRDPRLDEFLAAHEQTAGVSALQMPAGFLRNATFEGRGH